MRVLSKSWWLQDGQAIRPYSTMLHTNCLNGILSIAKNMLIINWWIQDRIVCSQLEATLIDQRALTWMIKMWMLTATLFVKPHQASVPLTSFSKPLQSIQSLTRLHRSKYINKKYKKWRSVIVYNRSSSRAESLICQAVVKAQLGKLQNHTSP